MYAVVLYNLSIVIFSKTGRKDWLQLDVGQNFLEGLDCCQPIRVAEG